ncbi:MAG: hypothetical protein IJN06_06490 [Bacteroidales bacterium]|nr:hypothetical protein [Bacteroidales bacterium]
MKRFIYIFSILIASFALQGCERDEILINEGLVPDGFMPLNIAFSAPDMIDVETKAVDPDGKGINSITLFCFDNFGMFIHYVDNVQIVPAETGISLTGVITETSVPENTRRIHFVANQNMSTFNINEFRGMSEYDVAAKLEGSSGMMIYWGYFAADGSTVNDSEDFQEALQNAHGAVKNDDKWEAAQGAKPIRMLRNQARFQVNVTGKVADSETPIFTKTGFTVVNTNAFGTVAPYHPEKGFNFSMATTGTGENEEWTDCDWTNDDFITLPHNTTRLSPPDDVDKADETCVFETDNNSAQPVSIIIKGKNNEDTEDKYYRVIFMDNNGEYIKVRRNFNYTINITGKLTYGQDSFEAALTAPATNNVFLSIDDDVKEITDNAYSLSVRETNIIVLAEKVDGNWVFTKPVNGKEFDLQGNQIDLGYNIVDLEGTTDAEDAPEASWVEGSNISNTPVINKFADREISVFLDKLDGLEESPKIEGTVILKKGVLQRKIKITVLKKMSFVPVWVSTQVNMDANSNVNLLFTVPESCPDELLPFKVYVSVNHLDIRNTSGRTFPVITEYTDPDNYGADTYSKYNVVTGAGEGDPIGYKYVYTVTQKGDQRMYFSNTVQRSDVLDNLTEWVTIESPYFETTKKAFTFNTSGDYRIEMPGLSIYTPTLSAGGESTAGNTDVFSPDEQIKYMLVPQKKNAPVTLDLAFTHWYDSNSDGVKEDNDINVLADDEFLFYSENLMHKFGHGDNQSCNCTFALVDAAQWGTGGTLHAFKFDNVNSTKTISFDGKERKIYEILALTKKAKSEEVVRISSNPGPTYAFTANNPPQRHLYRSIIFELANYRPFRFAGQISVAGGAASGNIKDNNTLSRDALELLETTDPITMTYPPNQAVDLYIDITSFKGSDGKSVDPFGTAFYVYIVAPMLDLPNSLLNAEKLIKVKDGVFAYKVDADRANEKNSAFKIDKANNDDLTDGSGVAATDGIDQTGERKKLTFIKSSIVADGEILITTDPVEAGVNNVSGHEEQIVNYYSKKFKITSQKITGTIQKKVGSETPTNLDADAFVSFALTRNNSRIGSMRIYQEGGVSKYELSLRPEYIFDWNDDNPGDNVADIRISHTHTIGLEYEVFSTEIKNLATLFGSPNIILIKQ